MPEDRTPVTVIGLGDMGRALAHAFLDNGHPTTVWIRTPGKDGQLVAEGAVSAATPADAVAASPSVVVCVLDYDAVHALPVAGAGHPVRADPGEPGTPEQARSMASWATGRGAEYVDGGIMAVPSAIGKDEAFVLYSGPRDAFAGHEPTLGVLGNARYLGADSGLASLYDLAVPSGMYGMIAGFLQGAALAGTEGIPATDLASDVVPLLTGVLHTLSSSARQIDAGDYRLDVEATLAVHTAALRNATTASRGQAGAAGPTPGSHGAAGRRRPRTEGLRRHCRAVAAA